uniref:Integrase core domain containing protein n=1 Tax=Angiostrongylus cantonensis TaxID=6313 RepID=A0A0K0CZ51_ANGCA
MMRFLFRWTRYSPIGTVIPRTRFIVFKTPLNDRLLTKVSRSQRFTVWKLFWMLAERGLRLGMIVDLTDTDRYYDKNEIEGMSIQYQKINCPGRGLVEAAESGNGSGYEGSPAQSGSYASPGQQHWAYQTKNQARNASFNNSPLEQGVQDEEMDDGEVGYGFTAVIEILVSNAMGDEDYEGGEEVEIGMEQPFVKSTAQKRRDRRQRMKNMLSVMKRGRFHEIQEMQREFVARSGTQ